jgi:uncharacterized radical SAM protein YgiQ
VPIVIGGIEASLRRIAHYDYWSNEVRRSILLDAKANLMVFGMGELAAWEIARRLDAGEPVEEPHRHSRHGAREDEPSRVGAAPLGGDASRYVTDGKLLVLPSYDEVKKDKKAFALMSRQFQYETNPHNGRPLLQVHGDEAVYFNRPSEPLRERRWTPSTICRSSVARTRRTTPTIPAYETVKHSIVTMRGCFGGCTFCSITEHEGRVIQSRSEGSVLREVRALSRMEGFSGVLSDLGGPTANMYKMTCKDEATESACRRLSCVHPGICENLVTDHGPLVQLMKKVQNGAGHQEGLHRVGVRYDLAERSPEFIASWRSITRGAAVGRAGASRSQGAREDEEAPIESYERFAQACSAGERGGGQRPVPRPVLHQRSPGLDAEGRRRARGST